MSSSQIDSTNLTFTQPQPRPVVRVVNWLGRHARRRALEPELSSAWIIKNARRRTGLSDGIDELAAEGLSRLAESLDREAGLTTFGRLMVRGTLSSFLEVRLRMRHHLRRHPEILDADLAPPVIVVGMPRTGTTLLYNLMALDLEARPLLGWESLDPVPSDSDAGRADPRRGRARWIEKGVNWFAPSLSRIHPFSSEGPEECTWLLANTLVSSVFTMFGSVPSYMQWLWSLGDEAWAWVYRDYREQLLALQHQRGGAHWLLKSPSHFLSLTPLLSAIPNARVIATERDPLEVVPSTCSLFAVFRSISAEQVDASALGAETLAFLSRGLRRMAAAVAEHPERTIQVGFNQLVADKLGTIQAIYDHFGLELTADTLTRMSQWIANDRHLPTHRYRLEQFGLTAQMVRDGFGKIPQLP